MNGLSAMQAWHLQAVLNIFTRKNSHTLEKGILPLEHQGTQPLFLPWTSCLSASSPAERQILGLLWSPEYGQKLPHNFVLKKSLLVQAGKKHRGPDMPFHSHTNMSLYVWQWVHKQKKNWYVESASLCVFGYRHTPYHLEALNADNVPVCQDCSTARHYRQSLLASSQSCPQPPVLCLQWIQHWLEAQLLFFRIKVQRWPYH